MTNHEQKLAAAANRYRRIQNELNAARQQLGDAIREAAADGVRQVDILRATDDVWTREQVRQVVKKGDEG